MSKQPKKKLVEFTPNDPTQGLAQLAIAIDPPAGYVFYEMRRTSKKVRITYLREDLMQQKDEVDGDE